MNSSLRPTGVNVLGEIPWGSHICVFYESALNGLLEYVHGEVSDNLRDRRYAEQLKLCIDHLKRERYGLNWTAAPA